MRLGDGTQESHDRVQGALDSLWRFTAELFAADDVDERMEAAAIAPALMELAPRWSARIDEDLRAATLKRPAAQPYPLARPARRCTPSTWGTCSRKCSICSAPIRASRW